MRLSELPTGDKAYIVKVNGSGAFRKRLLEMGFVRGKEVQSILNAPLKDPIKYGIMDYEVSLRRSEAVLIQVSKLKEEAEIDNSPLADPNPEESFEAFLPEKNGTSFPNKNGGKTIHVALVGNPNVGKTSIFNLASGAHERVANYSGVTVNSKRGGFQTRRIYV